MTPSISYSLQKSLNLRFPNSKVVNYNEKTGEAWVEYNGKTILVKLNDLFGINEKKEECLEGYVTRIEQSQADYDDYMAKIDKAKEQKTLYTKVRNFCQAKMAELMKKFGNIESLSSKEQAQYAQYKDQYTDANYAVRRAGWDISNYALWAFDEALHGGDLQNQYLLAKSMLG